MSEPDVVKRGRGRPKGSFKHDEEYIEDLADRLDEWIDSPSNFWLGAFAAENRLDRHKLQDFAKRSEYFKEAFERAKQVQENKLFMLGLSSKGNPTMCVFALKNVAGWKDNPDLLSGGLLGVNAQITLVIPEERRGGNIESLKI